MIHAHRGGAAIYPENTLEAMLHALNLGVSVLEMDLHITKDKKVVVIHDPYLNPRKVLTPQGDTLSTSPLKRRDVYSLTYDSLALYDTGRLYNPDYPYRINQPCRIP